VSGFSRTRSARATVFMDCSRVADPSPTPMSDVEYLNDVAFDRKQNSVDMLSTAVKELAHFDW
jgi:hypothetical protein